MLSRTVFAMSLLLWLVRDVHGPSALGNGRQSGARSCDKNHKPVLTCCFLAASGYRPVLNPERRLQVYIGGGVLLLILIILLIIFLL